MTDARGVESARRARRLLRALLAALLLASSACAQGLSSDPAARAAQSRIHKLLAPVLKSGQAAVYAREVGGPIWVAESPDVPLKPASVMKLFTTAAALDRFGPQFRYRTRFYVKNGELLVYGSGDPALGDNRLAQRAGRPQNWEYAECADRLRAADQTHIRTIALDDSIFERVTRHPDWDPGQADEWYQAPVGALNFNDNCLDVRLIVAKGEVTTQLLPPLPAGFVRNQVRPGPKHEPFARRDANQDVFDLGGTVTRDATLSSVACGNPTIFFGHAFGTALQQRGVSFGGEVVRRDLNADALQGATPLMTLETPLPDVIWRANTHSQNMFAEALLKTLAAYEPGGAPSGTPGSWDAGRTVLLQHLTRLGVDVRGATFRDGSGLSHDNRVTARQVVDLLGAMSRHPHAALYLDTLAEPGEDGSMRRRYTDKALVGRLQAKTGTIAGVSTLAGFIERPDGRKLAFAVLINGPGNSELIRKICVALAQ